jgi:DNA-binding transcriptional regulator YiaG
MASRHIHTPAPPAPSAVPRLLSPAARRALATPTAPHLVLRHLREQVGLSEADVARATRVSVRSVRRWSAGAPIGGRAAERLDDLRMVAADLAEALPPESIVAWLRGRNRALGRARPLDLLAEGRYDEVHDAVEALASGELA